MPAPSGPTTPNTWPGRTLSDTSASAASPASFALTNQVGAPASISLDASSTPQSAAVTTAYAHPLTVTVKDEYGNAVSGVSVTFASPSSGASATLSTSSALTNASGQASVTATAGSVSGQYSVTATVSGLSSESFALSNLPAALVLVAGFDPLRDEGVDYARRMIEAGNRVTLVNYEGMIHGFYLMGAAVDAAKRAIAHSAQALREAFAADSQR